MKRKTSYILFCLIGIVFLLAFVAQDKYEFDNRKQIHKILEKMRFIEGRTFTVGITKFGVTTKNDSTLLSYPNIKKQTVNSFYLSSTEVTNREWWEFLEAMEDKVGSYEANELYFPDTKVWTKDFRRSFNKPMDDSYFRHTSFEDYPVLGVSWVQAQAYCKWYTQKLKSAAKRNGGAAYGSKDTSMFKRSIYPWGGKRIQKDGKYLANFGYIVDDNEVLIKGYPDDGGLYTVAVASYPPNIYGLYDMGGNVAEWVSDTAKIYNHIKEKFIDTPTEIDSYIHDIEISEDLEKYEYFIDNLLHDREVFAKGGGDMRLVKGGSWYGRLAYLQIGSREAMNKEKKCSGVGFRIAASYDVKYEKYFPEKFWKPKKKKKSKR